MEIKITIPGPFCDCKQEEFKNYFYVLENKKVQLTCTNCSAVLTTPEKCLSVEIKHTLPRKSKNALPAPKAPEDIKLKELKDGLKASGLEID